MLTDDADNYLMDPETVERLDELLTLTTERELFSAEEVRNMLLDLRPKEKNAADS